MSDSSLSASASSSRMARDFGARRHSHRGGVLWFTGLSGSGKSTLAIGLENILFIRRFRVFVLDGDNLRYGLNRDLGFSELDRRENIRRATEVAAMLKSAGIIVICAFISPFREDRERSKSVIGPDFHEIFVDASLEICEGRDPKGLYKRARSGEISEFTGVSSPYEDPVNPAMIINTSVLSIETCLGQLERYAERVFGNY